MKNTSLLCLSSPEGDSNYYSGLMNLKKDNGESFFNVINCFQICEKCLKLERVKQINCTHVKSTAHWLSSKKIRELKTLYKVNPEDAIREFGGIVVSDYKPALRREEVDRCFSADPYITTCAPPYIFTACDPNGGGPSHMSIASGYFTKLGWFPPPPFLFDFFAGDIVVSNLFFCCGDQMSKYVFLVCWTKLRTHRTTSTGLMGLLSVPSVIMSSRFMKSSKWSSKPCPHKLPG
jgi:hypothetical protein